MTRSAIEALAVSLLLEQPSLNGTYALAFLDYRRLKTGGRALIGSIEEYEKRSGTVLPEGTEGVTLCRGVRTLILYEDRGCSRERVNFTVAHELGHLFLAHTSNTPLSQREANDFATSLLMPECVIRYLDRQRPMPLSPTEMTRYFAASLTACQKRRRELDGRRPLAPTLEDERLIRRLFFPEKG